MDVTVAGNAEIDGLLPLLAREGALRALLPMPHARHQMVACRADIGATAKSTGVARGWLVGIDFHGKDFSRIGGFAGDFCDDGGIGAQPSNKS